MTDQKVNQFHISKIILIGLILFISACGGNSLRQSVDDPYLLEPRGNLAQIVLYRPYRITNSSDAPEILVNGNRINDGRRDAKCLTNRVVLINLPAGTYKISMRLKGIWGGVMQSRGTDLTITVARGKRHYIRCGYGEEEGSVFTRRLSVPMLQVKNSGNEEQRVFDSKKFKLRGIYEIR
jgi:hypothetical protein